MSRRNRDPQPHIMTQQEQNEFHAMLARQAAEDATRVASGRRSRVPATATSRSFMSTPTRQERINRSYEREAEIEDLRRDFVNEWCEDPTNS